MLLDREPHRDLGSIWGGSAFKFGVYARRDQSDEPTSKGRLQDAKYGWLAKYGATAQEAFLKVRSIIVDIASSARAGQLDAVEKADLGEVTTWKLAFLYQDRNQPCIVPLYKRTRLQMLSGLAAKASCVELQRYLAARRGDVDVLSYGDALLSKALALESEILTTPQALAYLQASERFQALKPPTENMAGFRTADGRELALAMDNQTPTIYASPGGWLKVVREDLGKVRDYEAGKSRSSSLAANAPALALGNAIVSFTVPTMAVLDRLCEAYDGTDLSAPVVPPHPAIQGNTVNAAPLNQILFGPPGTGKTYATVDAALSILDPDFLEQHGADRSALKSRFDALTKEQRVRFVTFHQSFSYEDFVEGIRASVSPEEGEAATAVSYEVRPGVFVELCQDAKRDKQLDERLGVREGARVWKLSIEEASSAGDTRRYCLEHGEARIGWPDSGNLKTADWKALELKLGSNERHSLRDFGLNIVPGDVVVCLASRTTIGAVGVVSGEYEYTPEVPEGVRADYVHKLPVNWLAKGLSFGMLALNQGKQLTLKTVYQLGRIEWPDLLKALKDENIPLTSAKPAPSSQAQPHVLIIDEINRGNVSRIFGELITLIEPSKRAGAEEALEVLLPYSKKPFSVPGNVYLIGTMNTADRSLAGLDVALRRRFVFKAMLPQPGRLKGASVEGIELDQLLERMNQRIEALLDRDHCIGHAYFMPLLNGERRFARLGDIFRNQVLPLLQEYFFDDWQRIQWVLNDHRKPRELQFVQSTGVNVAELFGAEVNVARSPQTWAVNANAFAQVGSYLGIVDHAKATGVQ